MCSDQVRQSILTPAKDFYGPASAYKRIDINLISTFAILGLLDWCWSKYKSKHHLDDQYKPFNCFVEKMCRNWGEGQVENGVMLSRHSSIIWSTIRCMRKASQLERV